MTTTTGTLVNRMSVAPVRLTYMRYPEQDLCETDVQNLWTARPTAAYRAHFPTAVQTVNVQNGILAAPARSTRRSPMNGTHDSSMAGAP